MSDYGHWNPFEKFDPDEHYGFVYQITNTVTGEKYIGQKQLWSKFKRPPLKGRKNKRHATRESDWKKYTGSSNRLNEDIECIGKDKFEFDILELFESKWELSYGEYCKIIKEDAIPRNDFYNGFLGRLGACPAKAKY
jgi:hypothetical protein